MNKILLTISFTAISAFMFAQSPINLYGFQQKNEVPVIYQGDTLLNPWAGGINYGQVNTIDLNMDNVEDLLIFDRNSRQVLPFLNSGNAYKYAPQYTAAFPKALSWMLLRDYNCDGKKDIFFNLGSDIRVWENTSSGSELSFKEITSKPLQTTYSASTNTNNLFVTSADIPGIADIDQDGDLDIVCFENGGIIMEYHENQANCGLDFRVEERCWGHFIESGLYREVNLNSCTPFKKKTQHTGSTILLLDLNGDTLQDMILGNISYNDMTALYNGGDLDSTHFTSQDTLFPTYDKFIDIYQFPMATYEDVTFDGKPDLLVTPADQGDGAEDRTSIMLYRNDGTTNTPNFKYISNDFMQSTMIDMGKGAIPRFADLNGDSLLDLVVANNTTFVDGVTYNHFYHYYTNTGTKGNAAYTLQDTNFINISSYPGLEVASIPTFGDLDNDGDLDMIVGDQNGNLYYFTNSNPTNPQFTFQKVLNGLYAGTNAAPYLFDMDNDGDLDLLVGNKAGKVYLFSNGSKTNPSFTLTSNNYGGINVQASGSSGSAIPVAFEKNGLVNLFVGSEEFGIFQYDSVSQVSNMPSNLQVIVGTGNTVVGLTDETPFGMVQKAGRNQYLLRASELKAAGMVHGYINGLSFDVTSNNNGTLYAKMSVRIKMTQDSVLNTFSTGGFTEVYYSNATAVAQGWSPFSFSKPFLYDGNSNLIVEVCFKESANVNNNAPVNMTVMGYNCSVFGQYVDRETGCDQAFKGVAQRRPNILFDQTPAFRETNTYGYGSKLAPDVADLDNDGYLDMIVGTQGGGLFYYQGEEYKISLPEETRPELNTALNVFPNPGSGIYTIEVENQSASNLRVFDLTGRMVLSKEIKEKQVKINLGAQPNGIYIFMMQTADGVKTQKVIKH